MGSCGVRGFLLKNFATAVKLWGVNCEKEKRANEFSTTDRKGERSECNNHEHVIINHFYKYGMWSERCEHKKAKHFSRRWAKPDRVDVVEWAAWTAMRRRKWLNRSKNTFPPIYTWRWLRSPEKSTKLSSHSIFHRVEAIAIVRWETRRKKALFFVRDLCAKVTKLSESLRSKRLWGDVWVSRSAREHPTPQADREWDVFCVSRDGKKNEKKYGFVVGVEQHIIMN